MAVSITVLSRGNAAVLQKTTSTKIALNKASIVEVNVSHNQVKNVHQEGHSAVIVLKNGEVIRIDNFFGSSQNELVFQENDGSLHQLQFVNVNGVVTPGDYIALSSVDSLLLAGADTVAGLPLGFLAGAGAAGLAGAGIASTSGRSNPNEGPHNGGSGGNGGGNNFDPPPAAPIINQTPNSTTATVTITGTAVPGSVVTIYDNGNVIGSTTANSSGDWSYTSIPLSNGTQTVTATATNAGGASGPSNADVFNVNTGNTFTVAPTIDQTANSTSATPTITGTAPADSIVTLSDNGQVIGSTTANSSGNWSFTPSTPLSNGTQIVTATATTAAGTSGPSNADVFTVDTTSHVPLAPTINQTANSTSATPTITGTATAGSVVTISDNGQVIGSTTANSSGNWSFTPSAPLSNGTQTVTATATTGVGTSGPSNADVFTVDTTSHVPPAPTINQTANSTSATPTITGTATAGSVVTISDNGQVIGSTTANSSGNWSFTPSAPLSNGTQTVTATATTGAGTSGPSNADVFSVNTNNTVSAPIINQTANSTNTTPTITGSAPANALVTLTDNGVVIGSVTADQNGNWSFTPSTPLTTGSQLITATATLNGVISAQSNSDLFTISASGNTLDAPVIHQTISSTSTMPIITGTAAAGAVVTLTDNGTVIGSTTADSNGNWSFTPSSALTVGVQSVTAVATLGGDTSPTSNADVFTVTANSSAPAAPTINQTVSSSNTEPTITGTATAGAIVTIYDNSVVIGSTTTDVNGNWSFTPTTPLSVGNQSIVATATVNGLTSAPSNEDVFAVTTNTTLPAPIINQTVSSTSTTPTITGTATAGAVVTLSDNGTVIGSTTADANGIWSFTPTTPLSVGNQSVVATATVNGVTSLPSNADLFAVQPVIVAPLAPVINQTVDSTNTTPSITGTAQAGAVVTLSDNGVVIGSTTADASGNWYFTPTTPLTVGNQSLVATATLNSATSPVSNVDNFAVQPLAPIITQTTSSTNTTPTFTGTAAAGAVVLISDNGSVIGSTTADGSGNWSFTPSTPLPVGNQSITATASVNGVTSPVSTADNFIVTLQIPTVHQTISSTSTTPTFTGTATAGAVVLISDNGTVIGSTTADGSGNWSFTPAIPLSVGTQSVTVTSSLNGITSAVSNMDSFAVQPVAPSINQTLDSTSATPTITGTAVPGSVVTLHDNGTVIGSTTVGADGNWSFTPTTPLPVGAQLITATDTVNGATSAASNVDAFVVQPSAPVILQTANTYSTTPTITGTATAGAVVTISDNGVVIGSTTADASGIWSFTPTTPLSLGIQSITATDTVNGATSPVSSVDSFQITTDLVWGYQDTVSAIQGNVYSGGQTDDANGTLYGAGIAGSIVTISEGGTVIGSTTADASGNWSYKFTNLSVGTHNLTVTAVDGTGGSSSQTFTLTEYAQVAPAVALSNSELLGIVGADVAGLIDLGQQPIAVADQNGDLTQVKLNLNETLALSVGDTWAYDANLASYLGLNVATTSMPLLGGNMSLTVTAGNGQAYIGNQAILELLGTVHDTAGISISLADTLTLSGTDSLGHTTSQSLGSLLDVGLLNTLLDSGVPDYIHQSTTAGATINDFGDSANARLYAFGANSTLIAGSGNDIMRAMGGGSNILTGGSGNDWMDGGSGINTYNVGSGHTTVHYDLLNASGKVTSSTSDSLGGHSGLDVVNNFHLGLVTSDANADLLDITSLVGSGANAGNINNYLSINYNAATHSAVVSIDRLGDGIASNYHQLLTLNLDAATASGTLTVQDLIKNHQLLF